MTENTAIIPTTTALMPAMDIAQAVVRRNQLVQFVQRIMVEGSDFGKVPGTDKNTLLKPGAEKLTTFFGLSPRFEIVTAVEQWDGPEPFFYYLIRCTLYRGDAQVGEADGSCNSRESRYRWRWVPEHDIDPRLDKATLKRRGGKTSEFTFAVDKAETQGKYGKPDDYWQAFKDAIEAGTASKIKKATAKGAQYDAWEIDLAMYRVPNEDVYSQVNTVLKMAEKRALVAATLVTVNASEFFTQDMEDLIDVPVTVTVSEPEKPRSTAAQATEELFGDYNGDYAPEPKYATENGDWLTACRSWAEFRDRAAAELDYYKHAEHVKNTLAKVVAEADKQTLTFQAAYQLLLDHVASKEDDAEPPQHWSTDPMQWGLFVDALKQSDIEPGDALDKLSLDAWAEDTHADYHGALKALGIEEEVV